MIDKTQNNVEGEIKLKLYKGNITILGRHSKKSLYSKDIASFEGKKKFNPKFAEKIYKKKEILVLNKLRYFNIIFSACSN